MSDKLQQAIIAIRSGDQKTGKHLLIQVLKADQRNENAWLWMTKVVDSNDERIKCLQNVLKVNPNNEIAKRGLVKLQQNKLGDNELKSSAKSVQAPSKVTPDKEIRTTKQGTPIVMTILAAIGLITLLLCTCVFILLLPDTSNTEIVATSLARKDISTNTPSTLLITPQTFEIGDVIKVNNATIIILGWEEVTGTEFDKPEEGNKFIAVEVLFVNLSNEDVTIYSNTMFLKDSEARPYGVDIIATLLVEGGGLGGTLIPGERLRNRLGFQVPINVQGLQFIYEDPFNGKAIINLGSEPNRVEPPIDFMGIRLIEKVKAS